MVQRGRAGITLAGKDVEDDDVGQVDALRDRLERRQPRLLASRR